MTFWWSCSRSALHPGFQVSLNGLCPVFSQWASKSELYCGALGRQRHVGLSTQGITTCSRGFKLIYYLLQGKVFICQICGIACNLPAAQKEPYKVWGRSTPAPCLLSSQYPSVNSKSFQTPLLLLMKRTTINVRLELIITKPRPPIPPHLVNRLHIKPEKGRILSTIPRWRQGTFEQKRFRIGDGPSFRF